MRRFVFLTSAILYVSSCFAAAPPLTVIVAERVPPKMFVTVDGKPTGFVTELTEAIVRKAGYTPEILPLPWLRALQTAQTGKGVITGFSKNSERDKIFAYSDSIYEDRVQIVTLKKAGITASSLADLKGMTIGIQRGSSYGSAFDADLANVTVERDDAPELRIKKLALGRIQAAIISGGAAAVRYNADRAGVPLADLSVQKNPVSIDQNYIGIANVRGDQADILKKLNAAIAALKADGSLNRILAHWE